MIIASTLGQIFQPIFVIFADTIAFFYAIIPNYAIAISLLTIAVMVVTAPLTIKGTVSMMAMQKFAPEMKKIQQKYKGDKVKQNEELMALYKQHNISPMGGCLPLLLQLPVFFILYGVIDGLINTVRNKHHQIIAEPRYIGHSTSLYHHLMVTPGKIMSFGINLASKALSHQSSIVASIPFWLLVVAAIAAQYYQMRQMNRWNPDAAKANPQAQMMQKYMPIIMAVIYINIPAGVNIYFIVSSLCRIGLQEGIYRFGWGMKAVNTDRSNSGSGNSEKDGVGVVKQRRPSVMERMLEAQQRAITNSKQLEEKKQAMLAEAKGADSGSDNDSDINTKSTKSKGGGINSNTSGPANPSRKRPSGTAGNTSTRDGQGVSRQRADRQPGKDGTSSQKVEGRSSYKASHTEKPIENALEGQSTERKNVHPRSRDKRAKKPR